MTIGEAIKIVRTRRGLKQGELAARSEVSQSLVSLVENGRRQPSMDLVQRFCHAMHIPMQLVVLMGCSPKPGMERYEEQLSRISLAMLELLEKVARE